MIPRSYLYVPGDQPDKLAKAATRGADAIIADLEDAVPAGRKHDARRMVADWVAGFDGNGPAVWVRVNAGTELAADLDAIADLPIAGVSLAKTTVDELGRLDAILGDRPMRVIALVETPDALLDIRSIATSPRVVRLAIGEADLAATLGVQPSENGAEFAPLRMSVVVASAAAGLPGPIGPVSTNFRDQDTLQRTTEALRRSGFTARAAIHPAQIETINAAFTPSAEETARARRILERFDEAGGAACVDDDGRMIDEAIVRSSRAILDRSR